MMTCSEILQSFIDFFKEKQHSIVSSTSLMPQSPGLLFTNAGMNQFVPYFLGVWTPPWSPPRVADTQKCIRAGGKHNDLEDVGYDTYHHTFFEMLGNWSFGDYFKKQAIQWSWELLVERWGFPANRLYATVYAPDKSKGDPGEFDQESWNYWAELFRSKGLNPDIHIVDGNVKDNFWMMGETGPCGPCSELHIDLTPDGITQGRLVNEGSDQCIEIWNLVFIQYNAESDGTFRNLPAQHVDTGMGFERACSVIQCTNNLKDFSRKISNYATDVFMPVFRKLEELSGKTYTDIYPEPGTKKVDTSQVRLKEAIAFRVIADHVRTLSFSIADGILPGNNGRNYVLRRILRRAVRYGRTLGFSKPFLAELVDTLIDNFGAVFPELKEREKTIKEVLTREESSFNETLDRGLELFENEVAACGRISGEFAFKLYDTFGFPIDLTALLAEERGVSIELGKFNDLMELQRERARAARKNEVVKALEIKTDAVTEFIGYQRDECQASVLEVIDQGDAVYVITDQTPFYAEMGGQVSDTGFLEVNGESYPVVAVQQVGNARAHIILKEEGLAIQSGDAVRLEIDADRRRRIEANHTATHLLHKALHEVVSPDVAQQGSHVSDERLRFDFNSGAVSKEQIERIEELVNQWIADNLTVHADEFAYEQVKQNKAVSQFFGDKYGDTVRVVQVGGGSKLLDGVAMELCGGTHIARTGDIGLFKIRSEGAIASGVRRIEATTGEQSCQALEERLKACAVDFGASLQKIKEVNARLEQMKIEQVTVPPVSERPAFKSAEPGDIAAINAAVNQFDQITALFRQTALDAEKKLKKAQAAAAAGMADALLNELLAGHPDSLVHLAEGSGDLLQELLNGLKKRHYEGAAFLIVDDGSSLLLGAYSGKKGQEKGLQAGQLIQTLAPLADGRGGGRPDQARGSAPVRENTELLYKAARQALGL